MLPLTLQNHLNCIFLIIAIILCSLNFFVIQVIKSPLYGTYLMILIFPNNSTHLEFDFYYSFIITHLLKSL